MKNRRSFVKRSGMGFLAGVIAPTLQAQNSEVSEKNGIGNTMVLYGTGL